MLFLGSIIGLDLLKKDYVKVRGKILKVNNKTITFLINQKIRKWAVDEEVLASLAPEQNVELTLTRRTKEVVSMRVIES